jgi:exosome complex component RRP42
LQEDFRCDGRSRRDYRPMELETGIVSHTSGSARLRLANSDILVGVKTEIDTPFPERPNEGKLEFFIDCSANATPQFEGRGGEELATEISNTLQKAYQSSNAFDLKTLCIMPRQQCWKLYIDVLILECGGNLFDAVSLAVKGALYNTSIPRVSAALMDGGSVDLILSDDPYDCDKLDVASVPLLVMSITFLMFEIIIFFYF